MLKKWGLKIGKTKRRKSSKLIIFHSPYTSSANPHEVALIEATLDETITLGRPERIAGDRDYDSDPLDQKLAQMGIELIAPHKFNRKRAATQDCRALRRYKRRWKIELLFAWLNKFKRVLTKWDYCAERYIVFFIWLSL